MEDVQLLIGGEPRSSANKTTFDRLDPVTGDVATRASAAGDCRIHRAALDHRADWTTALSV